MIATNHALTGAIIGLTTGSPWLAVPVAFVSHFVCDSIPHFGLGDEFVATRAFKIYLVVDALLCATLVAVLAIFQPPHWQLASLTAFVATTPDFWSIRKFNRIQAGAEYKPGRIRRFSAYIQWFERPIGAVVEVVWAAAAIYLLAAIV